MTRLSRAFALALFAVLSLAAVPAAAEDLLVFAAASTKNAAEDIAKLYAAESQDKVTYSFAASSDLAKQIENGAPAVIFISADTKWMDYLAERKLIAPDSRRDLLGNKLVLIAPADSQLTVALGKGAPLADALGDGKLAMGEPESVPAGRYGKAALEGLGIWSAVEPKVARTKDVRAALTLVERGEAAAGIVYSTDAAISKKVKVIAEFPADSYPPIVYPVAIVAGKDDAAAKAFHAFLNGPKARTVFLDYGFAVNGTSAATN
ncbi:MAG TPA: molybdate ABC transporter substrate-binding protein [Dongiaceae bacterium]|jgi:molybdate transport system substrate-binding protein|nr:molybdate ABC transporter substrate-binding protein [Dongiaceae bacterium]